MFASYSHRWYTPLAVGLVFLILSFVLTGPIGLYGRFANFDKVLHLLGGLLVAWFASRFFLRELESGGRFHRLIILLGCVALVGVVWEFAEHLSNVYVANIPAVVHNYFYGGDLSDTLGDLTFDLLGALAFIIIP